MPPVVRIVRGRAFALLDQSGFVVVEDDQAAGGGLQLLDQSTVTGARWVDVQGCSGVHGVASLCGGRVKQIITPKVNLSMFWFPFWCFQLRVLVFAFHCHTVDFIGCYYV